MTEEMTKEVFFKLIKEIEDEILDAGGTDEQFRKLVRKVLDEIKEKRRKEIQ